MATPTATAPVHPHAEQFATESFGMTEGWSPVAAFPETTGQGVGAGLEPKELLIRFLGSDETLVDFAVQRFSVFSVRWSLRACWKASSTVASSSPRIVATRPRSVVDPGAGTGVDVAASSLPAS